MRTPWIGLKTTQAATAASWCPRALLTPLGELGLAPFDGREGEHHVMPIGSQKDLALAPGQIEAMRISGGG